MTRLLRNLWGGDRGAAALEFAIAVPTLVLFVYGIFIVGQLFEANAGMQHALGEAARYTTLYPTPTDTQIKAKVTSKVFGTASGTFNTPTVATDTTAKTKTITVSYTQAMNFLILPGPTITLSRSKKVYYAS